MGGCGRRSTFAISSSRLEKKKNKSRVVFIADARHVAVNGCILANVGFSLIKLDRVGVGWVRILLSCRRYSND